MSRADRYAMQLALCNLCRDPSNRAVHVAATSLRCGGELSRRVESALDYACSVYRDWRPVRVRLALLLRALLRAEPEPTEARRHNPFACVECGKGWVVAWECRECGEMYVEGDPLRDAVREYLAAHDGIKHGNPDAPLMGDV